MNNNKCKHIFIHVPKCGGLSIHDPNYSRYGHDLRQKNFKFYKDSQQRNDVQFSFTFVRNPWDRLVSAYHYLKNGGSGAQPGDAVDYESLLSQYSSFEDVVLNWNYNLFNQIHLKPQWEWICDDNGNLIVDFVGKFEHLQADYNTVCDIIKIPRKKLPHTNRSEHKPYTEYYNAETRKIVSEIYAKDIELFNYEFPG